MDTTSISGLPGLATARIARPKPTQIQGIPIKPQPVPETARPTPVRNVAPRPQVGGPGTDPATPAMLQQLKADWGKSDSPWDLNGDGTVNVRDFLKLLAEGPGADDPAPPTTTEVGPSVEAPEHADDGDERSQQQKWLDQLVADWGKADSPWDLNGDGTVNVRDLLSLLAKLGGNDAVPPPPTEVRPNVEAIPEATDDGDEQSVNQTLLDQLRADWGKADSPWDLNGDGTVNVRDFLKFLVKFGGGNDAIPPSPPQVHPRVATISEHNDGDVQADGKTRLDQLVADWGKTDSAWDLNGDGTVNVRDFLKLLAMTQRDAQQSDAPRERDAPRVGHVVRRAQAAYNPTTAQDMALIRRGLSFNAVG